MRSVVTRWVALGVTLGAMGGVGGCGALDVSDPTAIEESELQDAYGAELLRGAALKALFTAVRDGNFFGGLLADEFVLDRSPVDAPSVEEALDQRESAQYELRGGTGSAYGYGEWQTVRRMISTALPITRAHAPSLRVGELLAARGYAVVRLAEDYCPGFPLHEMANGEVVLRRPVSTTEAFTHALADLDSAVVYAADSARILNAARVWRGRALLGLGRFAEAAAAVNGVPNDYVANADYSTTSFDLWNYQLYFPRYSGSRSVANQEGGTGLDFISAQDPRVKTDSMRMSHDGVTVLRAIAKYPTLGAPSVLASGIEARLIEAEAKLQENSNDPEWLTMLNALRASSPDTALSNHPLTDPGNDVARVDLLFRERAFWLFATGHRLADLRRLVDRYGRQPDTVFPYGAYRLGGSYGTAVSIPFPASQEVTADGPSTGCTSR